MSEFWNSLILLIIGGIISQVLAPVFSARFSKTKKEKNVELSERLSMISDKTAAQLFQKLEQIDQMEKEITELQAGRAERIKKIEELQNSNDDLQAAIIAMQNQIKKETEETHGLRNEVQDLRNQVAEGEARYKELERKYANSKEALELILKANPDLKIPAGLEVLLGDSIKSWKWKDGPPR
jgi:predicted RNase H-like nuclease (RuvC/YqgF family)